MLVTLYTKDVIARFCNDDIEKFKSDREKNNVKRPSFLSGIRSEIFLNFEELFGLSADDLIENYTYEGKKIDRKFLQKKVGNAVNALFLGKKEKESHNIGEFERARRGMYSKSRTYEI